MRLNKAKEIIKNLYKDGEGRKIVVFLQGPPGIGKTSVVKEAAKELGIEYKDVKLITKKPTSFFIPEPDDKGGFREIVNHSILPDDPDWKGIICFDEFPSAPQLVQNAVHDLILERRLGEYELPEGAMIVLTGNRDGENVINNLFPATMNRIIKIDIEYTIEDFNEYAVATGMNAKIIAFFNNRPDVLYRNDFSNYNGEPFCSPRSIEKVDKLIKIFGENIDPELIVGAVGEVGYDLLAFMKENLVDPKEVINGNIKWNNLSQAAKHFVVASVVTGDADSIKKLLKIVDNEFKVVAITMLQGRKDILVQLASDPSIMASVKEIIDIKNSVKI